jgi:hypothetical protein
MITAGGVFTSAFAAADREKRASGSGHIDYAGMLLKLAFQVLISNPTRF